MVRMAENLVDDFEHDKAIWEAAKKGLQYKCHDAVIWAAGRTKLGDWNTHVLKYTALCAMHHLEFEKAKEAARGMRDIPEQLFLSALIFETEYDSDRDSVPPGVIGLC